MKIGFWGIVGCFLAPVVWADSIEVIKSPLSFPEVSYPGLEIVSVVELQADDERFGGLSALLVQNDQLLALSDKGVLFQFPLGDVSRAKAITLLERNGSPLKGKRRTDGESLAFGADGSLLVAFERDHRLVPYDLSGAVLGAPVALPEGVTELAKNSGFEAVETLNDGTLVLVAEGKKGHAETPLWVKPFEGEWQQHRLALIDGFRPTGLSRVAGHADLILMERYYIPLLGLRIRLSWLNTETWQRGEVLGELTSPLPVDNMEGISSFINRSGETMIVLVSDDNFNPLQRTLLITARLVK